MLILQDVSYKHPNKELLFSHLDLVINRYDKIALVGNNGTGKSTLLKIMAGQLVPSAGTIKTESIPYYIPQHFGQFNNYTVAEALHIQDKLNALKEILSGKVTDDNMKILDDDWTIEERCAAAFAHWKLDELELTQRMDTLSGGQKTKIFLAGIDIHQPEIVLLDEPSNHLDTQARTILYEYLVTTTTTLVVVSHDRTLLNQLNQVYELSTRGITIYGGNYDFYAEQKKIERDALNHDVKSKEKALRKAKETEREAMERQQKLDARGKKKQEKAGMPTIMMNTLRNNAEKSTAKLKGIHEQKIDALAGELDQLRSSLPGADKMKIGFDDSTLHKGKILITASNINYRYNGQSLWQQSLSFQITSGERIVLKGLNGSGKTTLLKLILGQLEPSTGTIIRADSKSIYIDQDYSLINNQLSIYEQAQQFNSGELQEHEIKIRLTRFLFTAAYWDKPCSTLSGGEKMRLLLCCLTISSQSRDIIVLDEPTNNLDIQNIEILTAAINEYSGTLMVVSHDEKFLEEIKVGRAILLEAGI